ncbi:MAG TPA: phosphatase domain-containing protein [Longimicrobium sp.]|nr:phosphatase domain-containing protein [Longimicrobium sp.]
MTDWKKGITDFAKRLDAKIDEQRGKLQQGGERTLRIEAYRGFGRADRAWVKARVLRGTPIAPARAGDSVWINLSAMLQRFESDEVAGARVRIRYPGGEQVVTTDREGYCECWIEPSPPAVADGAWHSVELELLEPPSPHPVRTTAKVLIPPGNARFGVISDLDDTVVRTDVASRVRMAKHVFLGNAHTRTPFPGVAAFYRALEHGADGKQSNPVFYVSSSPWNLFDVLAEFLELKGIPAGPLLLRDWGIASTDPGEGGHLGHKLRHIRIILEMFPTLPFILIGDSGQEDPEIYHRAVVEHPERILAVYIRNVSRAPERVGAIRALAAEVEKAGSTLILADDTAAAAVHASESGWISAAALAEVGAVATAEQAPPTEALKQTNEELSAGDVPPPEALEQVNEELSTGDVPPPEAATGGVGTGGTGTGGAGARGAGTGEVGRGEVGTGG